MKTADNFDFTFLDDAHPEARCGFMIEVVPGFVGMGRAARNDCGQVGGGNAHVLGEIASVFWSESNIHDSRVEFSEVFAFRSCWR
jgi:hypothetical protein